MRRPRTRESIPTRSDGPTDLRTKGRRYDARRSADGDFAAHPATDAVDEARVATDQAAVLVDALLLERERRGAALVQRRVLVPRALVRGDGMGAGHRLPRHLGPGVD